MLTMCLYNYCIMSEALLFFLTILNDSLFRFPVLLCVLMLLIMIWVCNLQGRFLSSLNTQSPALNVVSRRLLPNRTTVMIPVSDLAIQKLHALLSSTFAYPGVLFYNFSKLHGLVACGGEDGAVECFDTRMRSSIARINAVAPTGDADQVPYFIIKFGICISKLSFMGNALIN